MLKTTSGDIDIELWAKEAPKVRALVLLPWRPVIAASRRHRSRLEFSQHHTYLPNPFASLQHCWPLHQLAPRSMLGYA